MHLLRALAIAIIWTIDAGDALAKTVLIVAPHPDDESLMAAGVIRNAITTGDTVKTVVMTNGDFRGTTVGYTRQGETVSAMTLLGLREDNVVFLGYGDGLLMNLHAATSDTTVLTSVAGQSKTYGNRGLGRRDYHSYVYGVAGDYNRKTVLQDVMNLLAAFSPDDIYTTSYYDDHSDHKATYLFVVEALIKLKRQGVKIRARLHEAIVHAPCEHCNPAYTWPMPTFTPGVPLPEPPYLTSTPLRWTRIERIPVPPEMRSDSVATNLKYQAIRSYVSQMPMQPDPWLLAFVKKNEFSWVTDIAVNVALSAAVTVSSENTATQQSRTKAVDGVVAGYPGDHTKEWATVAQLAGAWIRLAWASPMIISQVSLHDRVNPVDNVLGGRLLFSDGSVLAVGALPSDGAELSLTFPPKVVTWVEFRVDRAVGLNIGLAEMRVLGKPGTSVDNYAPIITRGPSAAAAVISDTETTSVDVSAIDLDGDKLEYAWSTEGGVVAASGPIVMFTPPRVSADTFIPISVTVRDGRGGTVTNSTFVNVRPSSVVVLQSLTIAPAVVGSGQSAEGAVTLSTAAPSGGVEVLLRTTNSSAVKIPAGVIVLAGATRATFGITGGPVATNTVATVSSLLMGATQNATLTVVPNLARQAQVSVSSENTATGQLGIKAVDAVVDGWPGDYTKEWATTSQLAGAWIRLTWTTAVVLSEVGLCDRPNFVDNIRGGRLVFSDGSSVTVGPLSNDGRERVVAFPARRVTSVEFRIDQAVGENTGLAEIRAFSK
jgi:LmbE family N-acetylglucosaminyl deacetylase